MSGCKITERGWAGHFICAARCNFRRNTLIESGDTRVVVSTVGALRLKEDRQGFSDLGCDRTYETMAFRAGAKCKANGCACGQPVIVHPELEFRGYNDAKSATEGHYAVCLKFAKSQKTKAVSR